MKLYETLKSGIKIVEYDPSLAATIAELFNHNEDWGGSGTLSTESQIISNHETATHFNVYVALDGDKAVGYCSFGQYFYDANTTYVALLDVHPEYRNKKIGKALVLRCVQRTIELGYPRIDLYTWAGNTAAVPLYKKCGFMWEDRPNSTHLANFIPSIITEPLFADFFKKADWYTDSTRSLEIAPDGVEVNNFELFTYTWEKDGESLAVGYERTGRQMRMIETDDYKIELMAEDHELAFGTEYNCIFTVENKTGKELNIKINGREDANIKLDYSLDTQVTGKQEYPAKFYVGAIDEPQDPWKVHPCLLADIEINGQTVTFGMGIEARFPMVVKLHRECTVDQIGMDVKAHIGLHGSLLEDAKITVTMPKNRLLTFKGEAIENENTFTIDVPSKGKVSVPVTATTLAIGYEALSLDCTALLKSGKTFSFKAPLYIFTRDMVSAFTGEDLHSYFLFNGPWRLRLAKDGGEEYLDQNEANVRHLTNSNVSGAFAPPKFGKPYDDEFNLLKPNVKMYQQDTAMVMEVEFISQKFPGMVVTQIYTLTAAGVITRKSRVDNRGPKPRHTMLQDGFYPALGGSTVFSYKGQIHQNHSTPNPDGNVNEIDGIDLDYFDENWVFEASPAMPKGYCWPKEYKPAIKWGNNISFEIDPGELAPGQAFETKHVIYTLGLFTNYNDFRNYARQVYNYEPAIPSHVVDVVLNGCNSFVTTAGVKLDVINNREHVLEGDIIVSSDGLFETQTQTNPEEELIERNTFDIALTTRQNISLANVALKTVGYEKTYHKALFFPMGEITRTQEGTMYSVSNGEITFKVDPVYGNVCYSLKDAKGREWLSNKYPNHEPYSWFNPFLGGICVNPPGMYSATAVLKEKITAGFAEARDNFGSLWQGICINLEVSEYDEFKGAVYKIYFMTLPGLPMMCAFYKFENGTGEYKNNTVGIGAYLNPDDDPKNILLQATSKDRKDYCFRMGTEDLDEVNFENTLIITSAREEKMYMFHGNKYNGKANYFWGDNKISVSAGVEMEARAAHGETFTSSPLFFVVTDKNLPMGSLDDLERVNFSTT